MLDLSNAGETAGALAIRWRSLDVVPVLFDCLSVTPLLEIRIAKMHNRNFEIRFERERPVVFLNRLFVSPRPFIANGQTVMRVWLLRPKVYVTFEQGYGLIMTPCVRVNSAQGVV